MPKPRIQTRVDENVKGRVEAYAEDRDITQSEAMRHLIVRGLDYEAGELAATDGGDIEEMRQELQEREESERKRDVLLTATIVAGITAVVFPEPLVLLVALAVAALNIGVTAAPLFQDIETTGETSDG